MWHVQNRENRGQNKVWLNLKVLRFLGISGTGGQGYLWSCQDEKNPDCVVRLSNFVGVWYGLHRLGYCQL